ncbi:MAG: tRNA lysidine(34) synthetase TilS [Legionella sp.]|nr:tRNA lysidine(34) synthetase TilS [Legionella sp.]
MTELLTDDWLERLRSCNRLFIAYSGGLDSTVLLHALVREPLLVKKISAVHVNHGLSDNADTWNVHCQQMCDTLNVPLIVRKVSINRSANVEAQARTARYAVFRSLVDENDGLLLGHHLNDQAETVLLQLFRGAGVGGLAAMAGMKKFAKGQIFRPFLHLSRQSLSTYAMNHHLSWINDESNTDCNFSRNFLRHDVIPLLQTRWPGVMTNLARTASHCRDAQKQLNDLAAIDYPALDESRNKLLIMPLKSLSYSRINNVLQSWLKKNAVRMPDTATFNRLVPEVILAKQNADPEIAWDGYCVRRYQETLYLLKKTHENQRAPVEWLSFPKPLLLSSGTLCASLSKQGVTLPPKSTIQIRFRQGGEVFCWHGQTKSLKKLLQEWQIPPWQRDHIPLVYINEQLAAVVGYAVSDIFYNASSGNTYQITLDC